MQTDPATIESYDRNAEGWSKRIRGNKNYAHEFLEKPAMYGKLPDLRGLAVLCVGCGSGEECDFLKKRGAGRVVGIDLSKGLIEQAKHTYPDVEFMVMDMTKMDFPGASFDFVYSSLALHYVADWSGILKNVGRMLKPGGRFLFSTHHPVKWGADKSRQKNRSAVTLGYEKDDKDPDAYRIFGDYLNTRAVQAKWFDELDVSFFHKPLSVIFREILDSGLQLVDFLEPKASEGAKKTRPDFYAIHQKIPLFMIFELRKTE